MAKKKKEVEDLEQDVKKYDHDKMELVMKEINKRFGGRTVFDLENQDISIKTISTGIIGLDYVLGGGWPVGEIVEVFAENGVGKTTLLAQTAKRFQEEDERPILIIDAECKLNPQLLKNIGVDTSPNRFIFSQEQSIDKIQEMITLMATVGLSCIFIDGYADLVTERELNAEIDPQTGAFKEDVGHKPKSLKRMLRAVKGLLKENNTTLYCNNHITYKTNGYGNPKTTAGGGGLKYSAIARLELTKKDYIKQDGIEIGHNVFVYADKNQIAQPHKSTTVGLIWGSGFDAIDSLVETAVFADIIKQQGAWYYIADDDKHQGKAKIVEHLKQNPDKAQEIYNKTLAAVKDMR